jgi:hypothetical protein
VSPPIVTHATSGTKPAKCSASFFRKLSGMKRGKYTFLCPVLFIFALKDFLNFLPYGVGKFSENHASFYLARSQPDQTLAQLGCTILRRSSDFLTVIPKSDIHHSPPVFGCRLNIILMYSWRLEMGKISREFSKTWN